MARVFRMIGLALVIFALFLILTSNLPSGGGFRSSTSTVVITSSGSTITATVTSTNSVSTSLITTISGQVSLQGIAPSLLQQPGVQQQLLGTKVPTIIFQLGVPLTCLGANLPPSVITGPCPDTIGTLDMPVPISGQLMWWTTNPGTQVGIVGSYVPIHILVDGASVYDGATDQGAQFGNGNLACPLSPVCLGLTAGTHIIKVNSDATSTFAPSSASVTVNIIQGKGVCQTCLNNQSVLGQSILGFSAFGMSQASTQLFLAIILGIVGFLLYLKGGRNR